MAPGSGGAATFKLKLTNGTLAEKEFELVAGKSFKVGRDKKSEMQVSLPGVSNAHIEIKCVAGEDDTPVFTIRDLSMNGTSIEKPGEESPYRLSKDEDAPLPDRSIIVFPMKLRKGETMERVRLMLQIGAEDGDAELGSKPSKVVEDGAAEDAAERKDDDDKKAEKAKKDKKKTEKGEKASKQAKGETEKTSIVEEKPAEKEASVEETGKSMATPEPKAAGKEKKEKKEKADKKPKSAAVAASSSSFNAKAALSAAEEDEEEAALKKNRERGGKRCG